MIQQTSVGTAPYTQERTDHLTPGEGCRFLEQMTLGKEGPRSLVMSLVSRPPKLSRVSLRLIWE